MKYENEVKFLYQNYVPNKGKSNILQAELIRIIENLRYEALFNLNCNWNASFIESINFLKQYLPSFNDSLNELLEKGKYARDYYDGLVEMDLDKMVILDDSFYDSLLDHVIEQYYLDKDLVKIN
ncbi:MAG: hypothetical protein HUJ53_11330 [Holdemanella sp.]|nr:hypothetical protein [Holdemanella sp.]